MAETKKNIWNDDDGEEVQPKKTHGFRRFLVFLLILTAVLGVVVLAAYRDGTGFDVLRRYFSYGSVEKAGGTASYTYDAASSNRFAALGDTLVVLSNTSLQVLGPDGEEVWSTGVQMTAPALETGGGRAVAYDVGGRSLYVVDSKGQVAAMTAAEEEPFLAARLNREGWLAVTAGKKSYKGSVHVYDADMEEIFEFKSSNRFVTDAYVTDDGKFLAAVTLGQESSVFVSNVILYNLEKPGKAEPVGDYDVADGLVMDIGQQGRSLVTISDTCLTLADTEGKITASYRYDSEYLREFDLAGDSFAVLLLNRYQSGSLGRLVTVGTDGAVIGNLDVSDEVLSVSAEGRYIAVLYTDKLVIYNQDLAVYASLNGTGYAREVLMRPDGSALLIAGEKASLFLP